MSQGVSTGGRIYEMWREEGIGSGPELIECIGYPQAQQSEGSDSDSEVGRSMAGREVDVHNSEMWNRNPGGASSARVDFRVSGAQRQASDIGLAGIPKGTASGN